MSDSDAAIALVARVTGPGLCTLAIALLAVTSLPATAAVLNVPANYATIQAAINAARVGDEVAVSTGTYKVNLQLRSGIDVRGVETARTFLRAADDTQPVAQASGINDVLLANFTFIESAQGAVVTNSSSNIVVANNVFDSLTGTAVIVGTLSNAVIENNAFWRNNVAIDRFTAAADIVNNLFAENSFSIISNQVIPIDPNINVSHNCFYLNADLTDAIGGRGSNFQLGNPLLTDTANRDFHLRQSSPCIDTGTGTDVIDDTVADIGAYGGEFADATPFWLPKPVATNTSTTGPDVFNIKLGWDANLAYLVTNTVMPGSYRVWYRQNQSGPPFDGADAGNGTLPAPILVGDVTTYTVADLQPDSASPGATVLRSASPANQSITLNWNAATGATGYRIYYGEVVASENMLDVGKVTQYAVTGLDNDTEYLFAVSALAQPIYYLSVTAVDSTPNQNESDFAPEVSIALGNPVEGALSNELSATPEAIAPYPNLPDDGGCFVATAAFGADWVAEVQVLRTFRDRYLLTNSTGRVFVAWYYRNGPGAAQFLSQHTSLKPLVRATLWPLVLLAAFMLGASVVIKLAVLLLSLLLVTIACGPFKWLHRRRSAAHAGGEL